MNLNVSASVNVFRLLSRPGLCLPHASVSSFNDVPLPVDRAFGSDGIKAVVLDKDDCFAYPDTNDVYPPYKVYCRAAGSPHAGSADQKPRSSACLSLPNRENVWAESSPLGTLRAAAGRIPGAPSPGCLQHGRGAEP